MTVSTLFFIIAGIIVLGFAGRWLFHVTRIPDSLLLIAAGIGLSSLLGVDVRLAVSAAPYFGAFALLVILFEGGLHLEFEYLLSSWRPALILMATAFLFSTALITLVAHFVFFRPLLNALLLAAAISCTSAAIVIPLIRQVNVRPLLRTILELESSLSDAIAVLLIVTALRISATEDKGEIGMLIFTSLTGAIVIGIAAGLIWMYVLRRLSGQPLTYLVTFAGMLMVYAGSDLVHSSGVFGVFVFGLTLSNAPVLLNRLVPEYDPKPMLEEFRGAGIGHFHAELTFLVRTFFFVFLGMLFDFRQITPILMVEAGAFYLLILGARYLAVQSSGLPDDPEIRRQGKAALFLFMPRGLASAILATLPAAYGLANTEDFVPLTVLIILFTNLAITLGVRAVERRGSKDAIREKQ